MLTKAIGAEPSPLASAQMLRRKTMPAEFVAPWEHFTAQAAKVQNARRVVLSCLPVGRVDPAPVPVGLDVLYDELVEVRAVLDQWKVAPVEQQWSACRGAIEESLAAIPAAKVVAETSTELEELLGAVSDVVEPVGDAFAAAERRWLALRTRA